MFFYGTQCRYETPAHVLHMVGTRVRAKFRRRTTRRLGGDRPQTNKQTLKYLVDTDQTTSLAFQSTLHSLYRIVS